MEQNKNLASSTPGLGESYKKNTSQSSSSVQSIEYNAKTKVLSMTFSKSGVTYDYNGVTPEDALKVYNSPSLGNAPRNELSAYKGVKR